ncbi:Thiol-disulfide isomerase or thioredoxin [Rathayibacter oskolensis]|uniref:Thiol-disulfide isomerase or thioredoxin n=1 Tax=Rathayibacter oskolensis TaxID=1891671 RepID=A0A1X7P8R6_9MICO|nr:thioredoxin family protein [Rathayibacter oskolensis]SMH47461.1 Thiol-disulfide isomerase or thioredoxin [Rathayibacter oskolensis]
MDPLVIAAVLVGLVALGTALGVAHRRSSGRVRTLATPAPERIDPAGLVDGAELGGVATVVQFSTEFCTRCPAVHRMLADVAGAREGVVHLDVDLTRRADLADRFRIVQTPTLLVLDADGVARSRIGGAPARSVVVEELDRLLETP